MGDQHKKRELAQFKEFLTRRGLLFEEKFLNLKIPQNSNTDLIYNGQNYQMTTGDGEHFGKILKNARVFPLENTSKRVVVRSQNKNDVITEHLQKILEKKQLSAGTAEILVISSYTTTPFTKDDLVKSLENFSTQNRKDVGAWQEVWWSLSTPYGAFKLS